jgi:alginate O-acetyltransferase complex protein AlgJ
MCTCLRDESATIHLLQVLNVEQLERTRFVVWISVVAAVGVTSAGTAWNALAAGIAPDASFEIGTSLVGEEGAPELPRFSGSRFLAHDYQSEWERLAAGVVPLRPVLVRTHNEVVFSAFGTSPRSTLVVGRDGDLAGRYTLEQYCQRRLADLAPLMRRRVAQLGALQAHYEARQGAFLYVITPTKVQVMPESFVHLVRCPAGAAERDGVIPAYVEMLRAAGIHVVETTSLMRALHAEGARPFPVGGVHWNMVGAAHGSQAVIRALNETAGRALLPELQWTTRLASGPLLEDADVAVGLNLIREWSSPSTGVALAAAGPCPAGKLSLTLVATSFGVQLARALSATACIGRGRYFFGLTERYFTFPPRKLVVGGGLSLEFVEPLLGADVVLVEENAQLLPTGEHVTALFDLVARPKAR